MPFNPSRRRALKAIGNAAMFTPLARMARPTSPLPRPTRIEGPETPKLCLEMGAGDLAAGALSEAGMRRVKQIGVNHVLMGGPPIPWREEQIRSLMDRLEAGGLTLGNLMIGGFPNTLYG